jgi:hypothetical protein
MKRAKTFGTASAYQSPGMPSQLATDKGRLSCRAAHDSVKATMSIIFVLIS